MRFSRCNIRLFALSILAIAQLISFTASAQDELMPVKVEGTTEADTPVVAAREIQAHVVQDTARGRVIDLIGEKKYEKNKNLIESKIIRQAAKFIPFVNSGTPVQQPDGSWKMTVDLRLSMSSLRKMVQDAGIMNDADGPASVLPLVQFEDFKGGANLRWWQGENKDDAHKLVEQVNQVFYQKFQPEFLRQGFHLIKPLDLPVSPLPEVYRGEHLSAQDVTGIADFFSAPMVMTGEVRFKPASDNSRAVCTVRLQVLQVASNRVVAEVTRQIETDPGAFESAVRTKLTSEFPDLAKDLAGQVLEAYQRGTLNSNLIRLAVMGNLSPKQLGEFKTGLAQNLHEVKSVKERLFAPGEVLFEIDYSGEPAPLMEHLRSLRINDFETKVGAATDKEISLDVKALR